MLVEIELLDNILISEPTLLYSGDLDSVILDKIQRKFIDKCYKGALIKEIVGLKHNRGLFENISADNDGSMMASVCFTALGIVHPVNGFVHDCKINTFSKNGITICESKYSNLMFRSNISQHFKTGQRVILRNKRSIYKIASDKIASSATPFIPLFTENVIFKVRVDQIDTKAANKVSTVAEKYNKELKNVDTKTLSYFSKLLYPYKTKERYNSELKTGKLVDISQLPRSIPRGFKKGNYIYISYSDRMYGNIGKVLIHDHKKINIRSPMKSGSIMSASIKGVSFTVIEESKNALELIAHKHLVEAASLMEFCKLYNTQKKINDNKQMWSIYEKYKG